MATETFSTVGKWALALFFLGITIYIFYMVLFPRVGGSLWENIKIPISFGQEKLEPGYHDIPPKIVENIERISNEINNDTNFDKKTKINKELKLNPLGNYKLAIIRESDSSAGFEVYFKELIYPYDVEIEYVPCIVNAYRNRLSFTPWKVTLSQKMHLANKITFVNKNHFTYNNEKKDYEFYGLIKIGEGEDKNICFVRLNNEGYKRDNLNEK